MLFLNVIHKNNLDLLVSVLHKNKRNATGNAENVVHPWPTALRFLLLGTILHIWSSWTFWWYLGTRYFYASTSEMFAIDSKMSAMGISRPVIFLYHSVMTCGCPILWGSHQTSNMKCNILCTCLTSRPCTAICIISENDRLVSHNIKKCIVSWPFSRYRNPQAFSPHSLNPS